ncbi:MAG: AAA family ATPase [Candidatus Aminicenantes bacterium]|nr:MAG: AAA family ATPase [Candidatus Aminicenantes bacterium]
MEDLNNKRKGEVWAIGGAKGGTGKSFLTSSMGTYLALKEKRVVLIDVDIGGANLHSFLGIKRPKKSLTNFFEKKTPLNKLLVRTSIGNMSLITGDIHSLSSDNIKFTQKLKLFRHIMKLNTDYALIDLGGGSHKNTIDAFLMADKTIAILEPEITAVENLYHFVKNALFRKVRMALRAHGFKEMLEHVWNRREKYRIKNLKELIDWLKGSFSYIEEILDEELSDFSLYIVLNKVRTTQDIAMGASLKSVIMKYLGIKTKYVGYIEYDDSIWRSLRNGRPYMQNYASTPCAKEIETIAENLLEEKEIKILKG